MAKSDDDSDHSDYSLTRRRFVTMTACAAGLLPLGSNFGFAENGPAQNNGAQRKGAVPYRTLGRTGEKVSLIGVGGYHLGKQDVSEDEAVRIVRTAIDNGVNFIDNSWDYNNGVSEQRLGKALQNGYRQKVFLMTKIDGRDAKTAAQQLDQSLQRLKTDHLDLLQFHEVIRMNDADRVFAPGGALEAALAAKKAGKLHYIGFTGHKSPEIHLHMLEVAKQHNFHFDTVQMPLNIFDAHFDSFQKKVLPVAVKEGIGILGMKPMGDHFLLETKTVTPAECLHWEMNLPTSVVITGIDSMNILRQNLKAARDFQPLSEQEITTLMQKTAQVAKNGEYEKYKTSHHFDSTYHNPQWLGPKGQAGEPAPA